MSCDELLQMMMKFQLCYEIPGRPGVYIAPQLLADNQPDYPWDDAANLRLRYTYDFMPKGMLTRFIVAMHPYIWQQKYVWRSGVILDKDDTRAEVIEYYGRRRIEIRLSGQHKRDLMTTVRDELGKIHASYPPLKYEEWIPCNCASCQTAVEPHFYRLRVLRNRLSNHKYDIECDQPPYDRVDIGSLIDDIGRREQFLDRRGISAGFNLKNIRVLLTEAFSDEELRQLCYDETPFKPVYEQLTQAMSKDTLIHHLIEYAERRDLVEALLAAVQERNPAKYNKYHPY